MTAAINCEYSVAGNGPPLILIHGIGAARDTWRYAIDQLTHHFTVVTYDLRGHGTSPMPSGVFGLNELIVDLEALRKACGFDSAHFAGHSLGGMIGPAYARAYPQRVRSLGLLSTAAFRTDDDIAKVLGVVEAMEQKGVEHADIVDRRLQQVVATDEQVFLNVFRIYASTEMAPWLHEIQAPSLVLTGENDGGCNPRLNKQIDAALPDSEFVVLPNYKHSILLEAGQTVAAHLIDFIQRVETRDHHK